MTGLVQSKPNTSRDAWLAVDFITPIFSMNYSKPTACELLTQ